MSKESETVPYLREYQNIAIESWIKNNMNGIFSMATGTGKTYTAIYCIKEVLKINKKFLTVISCPYVHLLGQWEKSLRSLGFTNIFNTNIQKWKDKLYTKIIDLYYTDNLIVLTTSNKLSDNDFINIIEKYQYDKFLIVDEVHGIGSQKRRAGLLEIYKYRLGLSATPERYFDEEGTDFIINYFYGIVYTFSLKQALNTINPDTNKSFIVHYDYLPYFINLDKEEETKYMAITKKLVKIWNLDGYDEAKEQLLFKRQNIIKNAFNKYNVLREIIDKLSSSRDVNHTLVYCSPQQISVVQDILNEKDIIQHKFTMNESTKPDRKYNNTSERDFILSKFSEKSYNMLVAIKCLDEGVDVPSIKNAILMSSSGNSREWYQRMGRILRRCRDKDHAYIYDIIVKPPLNVDPEFKKIELKLFEKELRRYDEFSYNADNSLECLNKIYKIKQEIW
jgi:superfamily II DNA or RNA helicase